MHKLHRSFTTVLALALLGALPSCGGGGGGGGATIATAPVIATQPQTLAVTAGQPATFTVTVSGTAPISYQWQVGSTNISGATSATYTVPSASAQDNGASYVVVVSNAVGTVTSSTATLSVNMGALTADTLQGGPLDPFVLSVTGGFPVPTASPEQIAYSFALEYTLGTGLVITVPALVETDGTIHGMMPPGAIANGAMAPGPVSVRVRRSTQTGPTATPVLDFSDSLDLTVVAPAPTNVAPGYPTQLLIEVGKYLVADGAGYSNGFVTPALAQSLQSFDFDGLATNIIAGLDPATLQQMDILATATLKNVYGYDISTGSFVQPTATQALTASVARTSAKEKVTAAMSVRPEIQQGLFPNVGPVSQDIANNIRSNSQGFINAGKDLGMITAVAYLVGGATFSPLIVPAATVAGILYSVGLIEGTGLGFGVDMAATWANDSASPQATWTAGMKSLGFFAKNEGSQISNYFQDPVEGPFISYAEKALSPVASAAYQAGSTFFTQNGGAITEAAVNYGTQLETSDPTTSATEQSVFNADLQSNATQLADASLGSIQDINVSTTGAVDFTQLENDLGTLASLLETLSTAAVNSPQITTALGAFGTCIVPFSDDLASIAEAVVADGGMATQQEIDEVTNDAQGMLGCGSLLTSSLQGSVGSASATATATAAEGSNQVQVTAADCDANGCWITERTTEASGSESTQTGYVACLSSGFCPLFLN